MAHCWIAPGDPAATTRGSADQPPLESPQFPRTHHLPPEAPTTKAETTATGFLLEPSGAQQQQISLHVSAVGDFLGLSDQCGLIETACLLVSDIDISNFDPRATGCALHNSDHPIVGAG